MKNIISVLLLVISASSFSQEAYIFKKDGTKIVADPESIEIIPRDERIGYKLPGKTWEKYVRYKDLDYVSFNGQRFQHGVFVLAENDNIILSTLPQTQISTNTMRTYFYYRFVDKKTKKTIHQGTFTSVNSKSNKEKMESAIKLVKKYFADCPQVMEKVSETAADREAFFWDMIFIDCN